MKLLVAVKRVIDFNVKPRVKMDGSGVDLANVKMSMNPFDEIAVEEAIRLKEKGVATEIVAVSIGPAKAQETLRTALAMGADGAVLLKADRTPEGLAAAKVLAEEIRGREYDLVLFGMKAVDDDLQAVGAMVAELLGIPVATAVTEFSVEGGKVTAHREIEGGAEVVELRMPCAVTLTKGAYEPRYASLKGIMAAKKKPLEEKPAQAGDAGAAPALSYPPERQAGRIVGEGPDAVPELLRLLRTEAKVI